MWYFMIWVTVLMDILGITLQQNLVCNGDFEIYALTQSGSDSQSRSFKYDYFPNNGTCWYSLGNSDIQVKTINAPVVSKVFDFVSTSVRTLCQDFNLVVNATYQLNYSLRLDQIDESAIIKAYDSMNGALISNISGNDSAKIYKTSNQFVALKNQYRICFSADIVVRNTLAITMGFQYLRYGPCLDNITLIMTDPPPTINNTNTNVSPVVDFPTNSTENTSSINNSSNFLQSVNVTDYANNSASPYIPPYVPPIINPIIPNFSSTSNSSSPSSSNLIPVTINVSVKMVVDEQKIYFYSDFQPSIYGITKDKLQGTQIVIDGQLQTSFDFIFGEYLTFQLTPQRIYTQQSIRNAKLIIPQTKNIDKGILCKYKIYINGKQLDYSALTSEQQIFITNKIQPVTNFVKQKILSAVKLMQFYGISYFILNLIGFWNLTILYKFIYVQTFPAFARNILQQLAFLLFNMNSFSSTIFRGVSNYPTYSVTFAQISQQQKIDKYQGRYAWFGTYGMTTNFIANNIQNLLLTFLFIFKFFTLKFFTRFLPQRLRDTLSISYYKFLHILIAEISCFTPFFMISSTSISLNLGQSKLSGLINTAVQIICFQILMFITLVGFCLHYSKSKQTKCELIKMGKSKQYSQRITKFNIIQNYDRLSYFIFCFTLPILVIFKNKHLFFLFSSILVIGRAYYFFKYLKFHSLYQKAFRSIYHCLWLIFHIIFIYLYLASYIPKSKLGWMLDSFKYCRFIIIFCVLIGGAVDILDALINLIHFLWEAILLIRQQWMKKYKQTKKKAKVKIHHNRNKDITKIKNQQKNTAFIEQDFPCQQTNGYIIKMSYRQLNTFRTMKNISMNKIANRTKRDQQIKKTKTNKFRSKKQINFQQPTIN